MKTHHQSICIAALPTFGTFAVTDRTMRNPFSRVHKTIAAIIARLRARCLLCSPQLHWHAVLVGNGLIVVSAIVKALTPGL
jgi:hypothetical protein